jgi:hypothetical protein
MAETRYRIVETDMFGGDYPDEKFVNIPPTRESRRSPKDRRHHQRAEQGRVAILGSP